MKSFDTFLQEAKEKYSGWVQNGDVKDHDDWLESEGLGARHGKKDKTHTKMHYSDHASYNYGSDFHDTKRKD